MQPTMQPTGQPTRQPSAQPTSHPTTSRPTSAPSASPTKYPTTTHPTLRGITNRPTSRPTGQPTYFTSDWQDSATYELYEEDLSTILEVEGGEDGTAFGTFYYKGITPEGTCADWRQYTTTYLILPYDNIYFSQAVFRSEYYDFDTQTSYSEEAVCRNAPQVQLMIDSLQSGESYEFNCDGRSWRIFTCNGERVMCLNCKENCVETVACPGVNHIINPCMDNPVCTNRAAAGAVISFAYEFIPYFPEFIDALNVTVEQTSLQVSVNVTKAGTIYCGAFVNGTTFTSLLKIREQGYFGYMTGMGTVSVYIDGLGPDTAYDVYCYTEDYAAHVMPLELAREAMVQASTLCCKSITFDMEEPLRSIPEIATATANPEYGFTLSSKPNQEMVVNLNLTKFVCADASIGTSPYYRLTTVSPSSFTFTGDISEDLSGYFTVRGYQGCYALNMSVTYPNGDQVDSFETDYTEVTIINQFVKAPDVPALERVVFGADGLSLNFHFDSPTNAPIYDNSSVFACDNLVSFNGVDNDGADCRWISASHLRASLSYDGVDKPSVGSPGATVSNGHIQAECTVDDCSSYGYMDTTTKEIESPADATVPYVSLSSSKLIGSCDDIILDPTGSTGHGGRPWASVLWDVTEFDVEVSNLTITQPVEDWLSYNYPAGNKLSTVPNDELLAGVKYTISLTLENFLGKISTGSVYVEVDSRSAIPQLSIAGPSMLIKYRSQSLNLFAVAQIPSCAGSVANQGITYEWKVYEGARYLPEVTSYSADPRYFKIAPFTLSGSTEYTIQVTATGYDEDNIDPPISYYSVLVQVGQAGVESIIAGGDSLTSSYSQEFSLDGSDSRDLDATSAETSVLTFAWTCIVYSPEYGDVCSGFSDIDMASNSLTVPAETLPAGKVYQFSLKVINEYDMADTSSITVDIVADAVPLVAMTNPLDKYNAEDKIVLTGTVTAADGAAEAYWTASGLESTVSLADISATPTTYTLPSGATTVQISLKSDSLLEGLSYTFTLNSVYSGYSGSSRTTASVSVVMNEAPTGGTLTVNPTSGIALNTSFTWETAGWSDDVNDYPLEYIFSYYVSFAYSQVVVKSASEVSYSTARLGAGQSGTGQITCVANASDTYGATGTTSNTDVTVSALESVSDLKEVADKQLARAFRFVDPTAVNNVLSGVTETLNAVDCNVPTSCFLLNRYDCSDTAQTCGPCLPGYIGVEGDSNVACGARTKAEAEAMSTRRLAGIKRHLSSTDWDALILPHLESSALSLAAGKAIKASNSSQRDGIISHGGSSSSSRVLVPESSYTHLVDGRVHAKHLHRNLATVYKILPGGSKCIPTSDVSVCITGVCELANATDTVGLCTYPVKECPQSCSGSGTCIYRDYMNEEVATCLKSNVFCRAECVCDTDYYGQDCSVYGTSALALVKEVRDDVCFNLESVQAIQNENEDTLLSRATLVAETLIDYEQISSDAFETCVALLTDTVATYPEIVGSPSQAPTFVNAFSIILEQRTLLSDDVYSSVLLGLQTLMGGFHDNLAIGEDATSIKAENVRLVASLMTPDALSNGTEFSIPRTEYEEFDGTPDETVSLNATELLGGVSTGQVVATSITALTNNPTNARTNSSIIKVRTRVYSAASGSTRRDRSRRLLEAVEGGAGAGAGAGARNVKSQLKRRRNARMSGAEMDEESELKLDVARALNGRWTSPNAATFYRRALLAKASKVDDDKTFSLLPASRSARGRGRGMTFRQHRRTSTPVLKVGVGQRHLTGTFPTTTIGISYTVSNAEPITYNEVPVSRQILKCYRTEGETAYNEIVTCPTGATLSLVCPGTKGEFNVTCPSYKDTPQCQSWDGDDYSWNPLCKATDYTSTATTCDCVAGDATAAYIAWYEATYNTTYNATAVAAGRRALGGRAVPMLPAFGSPSAPSFEQTSRSNSWSLIASMSSDDDAAANTEVEQSFTTRMTVVRTSFEETYTAAPPIIDQERDIIILITVCTICGVFVLLLVLMLRQDTYELRVARKTKLSDKKMVRTAEGFFTSLIPPEFAEGAWYEHWKERILIEHTWLSLFFLYHDQRNYRTVKLVVLFSNFLSFLFVACITAIFFYGSDDGSCEMINFESPCITRMTVAAIRTDCNWNSLNDSCGYATPLIDALAIIAYTALITVVAMPIAKLMEACAHSVLISKQEVIETGHEPFFWSIKEKKRYASGASVVPVDDEGDEFTIGSDDSRLDENVPDVNPDLLANPDLARDLKMKQKEGTKKRKEEEKRGRLGLGPKKGGALEDNASETSEVSVPPELEMEYWELCDELVDSQTVSSKMLRAARLRKMQEYADYVLPIMEVEMLIALSNHELKYFGRQLLISDPTNIKLQYKSPTIRRARYTTYAPLKGMILDKINTARRKMEYLKNELEAITRSEDQEKFLFRHFLVDNMDSFRKRIAERYLLGEDRYKSPHLKLWYKARSYLSVFVIGAMWALLIYYIMVYNLSIGSRATALWMTLAVGSILLDAILFQPIKIWLRWICINSWVAKDVRTILNAMSKRYIGIIQRKAGIMRDANSLVQHFNPACRAARQFPHLPISRFLLSLNDYDVPHFTNTAMPMKLKRGWAWWHAFSVLGVSMFLSVTTMLWYPLGDIISELLVVAAMEITMVVLYYIGTGSVVVAVLITLGLVAVPFVREWYIGILRRRKKRKMDKLMKDESFLQYHLGGDKQRAGVTKDEYLADQHMPGMGGHIDDTAQFKSKFKPVKGEITEKYNPNDSLVVPVSDDVQLYEQNSILDRSQTNSQVSFGGLPNTSGSGLAPANWEDQQAQVPTSQAVKRYGGGGAFGASRPMKPLPPIGDRPANQQQVAEQIAQLEKNITLNLESIIKESIDKSSLHAKRKAARRKQVRASGKIVPGDEAAAGGSEGGELDGAMEENVKIRSPKRSGRRGSSARGSRRKGGAEPSGPGLSARREDGDGQSAASSGRLLDADNNVDFLKGFNSDASGGGGDGSPTNKGGSTKKIRIGGSDKFQSGDKMGEDEEDDSSGSEMKGYVSPEAKHSNRMLGRREKEKPHDGVLEPGGHPSHRVPAGGRLKPIEMDSAKPKFGEDPELIEIRSKQKHKTVVDSQFPSWH
jgi:hypothetical protein